MGFGKDHTGVIIRENFSITLGGLASGAAITGSSLTMGEDFRMLKAEVFTHVDALTAGEGQGLIFGIANGELSDAEIGAALTNNGPTDLNDRVSQELSERNVKIFSSALFRDTAGTSRHFTGDNGGPLITSKHRWTYSNSEGWVWFVFNDGPTITTGATARVMTTIFGVWVV